MEETSVSEIHILGKQPPRRGLNILDRGKIIFIIFFYFQSCLNLSHL
jgi:hypothetical protein